MNLFVRLFIIILVIFSTTKYHYRFNLERKFMDLENVNLEKAVSASILSPKFKNLKWITPFSYSKNPKEFFWTILLILARIYLWFKIFTDLKLKKESFKKTWTRVETTK